MARYVTGFVHADAAIIFREFQEVLLALRRHAVATRDPRRRRGLEAQILRVQQVQVRYMEDMGQSAVRAAGLARKSVQRRFDQTKSPRSARGGSRLRRSLTARPMRLPLPTGDVGIGDADLMNKVRNPFTPGYGPYWRAQEEGTGAGGVPSQLHRRIHGFFTDRSGGGNVDIPRAGGGTHARFIPSSSPHAISGPRGGTGGPGEIRREIKGRHFIRDGTQDAYPEWLRLIRQADNRAVRSLRGLLAAPPPSALVRRRRRP